MYLSCYSCNYIAILKTVQASVVTSKSRPGADLDLTARGGIIACKVKHAAKNSRRGFVTRHLAYYIYMTIDKVTRIKSLKQSNMPVFVISSKFIYYIVILQILSNLFLNGQNVSDTVLTITTNNKKMVEIFFQGWQSPPLPPPP